MIYGIETVRPGIAYDRYLILGTSRSTARRARKGTCGKSMPHSVCTEYSTGRHGSHKPGTYLQGESV